MGRLLSSLLLIAVMLLVASTEGSAQRPDFGPAVRNYLVGLDEEFKELDFQVRHGEISRALHAKARARLQILRRHVERLAFERDEDRVPEIEVLTVEEFSALGLASRPNPAKLQVGGRLGERWNVIAIESGRPQFFVFERAAQVETEAGDPPRANKQLDPGSIIETVVIDEPVKPQPAPTAAPKTSTEIEAVPRITEPVTPPAPQIEGPRVLRLYLPGYSQQALAKGIEGDLLVSAVFRRDGKIKDMVVEKGLGHGLDERAKESVRRTEFEPAMLEREPIDVRATLVFNFSLMKVTVRVREARRLSEVRQ